MSSQERWDVVLRFLEGPLSFQGDSVWRGPVVRMGANPGPGGVKLDGYRGLDNRQAVITAYDGGSVSIAPVGQNQVRVAPHENVDWNEVQQLTGPVYLSPGAAFHLGPPGRGVTATFVEARRLGVWEQRRILSDASQASPEFQASNVKQLDAKRGVPLWFIPAVLLTGMATTIGVALSIVPFIFRDAPPLGPVDAGEVVYKRADGVKVEQLDPEHKEGINQAFLEFVMRPNADQAGQKELIKVDEWDAVFLEWTYKSVTLHARGWDFWKRLDSVVDDYAFVVKELREARMPEVFAAIPYQESRYKSDNQSPVCAQGYWQLMPEVAHRMDLAVRNCKMRGTNVLYTPKEKTPIRNVLKNATYVSRSEGGKYACKIQGCEADERTELQASTRAAIELLAEAWNDPTLADSGAAVQLAILSHNAGYDDSRFGQKKGTNVLPAYKKYLKQTNQEWAPDFYGNNITCIGSEYHDIAASNKRCDGVLPNQSQHYAYSIVAQHILAVCYYALNYGTQEPFNKWRDFSRNGYCENFQVPTAEKLRNK